MIATEGNRKFISIPGERISKYKATADQSCGMFYQLVMEKLHFLMQCHVVVIIRDTLTWILWDRSIIR